MNILSSIGSTSVGEDGRGEERYASQTFFPLFVLFSVLADHKRDACIYGEHFQQSMDQPGMVANHACGQLTGKMIFFLDHVRAQEFWYRETGLVVPSRVNLLVSHSG